MSREQVDAWLERYVKAWQTYEPERIGDLFSEDAEQRYQPYGEPARGREAIVASWLEHPDPPGSFKAQYHVVAVEGDDAVAVGSTIYLDGDGSIEKIFDNVFVMRFDADGRCRDFTEWYMQRPG